MYGDKKKITRGDIITAAKKKAGTAKRGKTKMKAQKGKIPMSGRQGMSDQDLALMQKYIGMIPKGSALAGKALDKLIDNSRMSDQDLAMTIFSQMKKAAGTRKKKKTTARRAGGLTAAVKKIKADKGKAVVSNRLKSLQKQTSMKLPRLKALQIQTSFRRRKK